MNTLSPSTHSMTSQPLPARVLSLPRKRSALAARITGWTAVIFLAGAFSTLSGANGTWSGGGSSGNWSDTANWGNGSVAGATSGTTNTDAATLPAGVSNRTLTLDSDINVGSIKFTPATGGNSYTIDASSGFALRLSSGAGITINASANSGAANTLTINAPIILEAAGPTSDGTHATYSRSSNYLDLAGSISGGTTTGTVSLLIDGNTTGKTFVSGNISDGNATSGVAVEIKAPHIVTLNGTNTFSAGLTLNSTVNNNIVAAQTGTNTKLGTGTITVLNKGGFQNSSGTSDALRNVIANDIILEGELGFINSSFVELSGNISLGDGGATRTIYVNTGTLNITGVIEDGSATPVLHKTGGGYLRLYAANTFTGGIVLDGGTNGGVWLDNDAALGTGTLTINSSSSGGHIINSSGRKVANAIVLNADFSVVNSDIELQGAVSLGTAAGTVRKIYLNAGTFSMNGVISDGTTAKAIEKIGNGGMRLGGNNTFTGGVTLSAGKLYVNHNSALGTGTFAISNGTITATGKTLTNAMVWNGNFSLQDTYTTEFSGAVSLGDAAGAERTISTNTYTDNTFSGVVSDGATGNSIKIAGGGSLVFTGNNTYTGTTTISGSDTRLFIGAGGTSGTLGSGNVINNASLYFNRTGTLAVANDISGSGSVTKNGTGTVILQGNSTYTGTTTINAGSLLIDGTHADAGAYSVASGGTLGGNGSLTTWDNAVTVSAGGHLAPGSEATTGTLTLDLGTANLNISAAVAGNATNALAFRLDQTITPSDRVTLTSLSSYLVIGSGALNFDDFAFSLATPFSNGNYTFTLFQTENAISGTLGSNLTGLIDGHNATLSLSGDSKSLLLGLDVVPEPGMAGLVFFALAIGTASQMLRRRR